MSTINDLDAYFIDLLQLEPTWSAMGNQEGQQHWRSLHCAFTHCLASRTRGGLAPRGGAVWQDAPIGVVKTVQERLHDGSRSLDGDSFGKQEHFH